MRKTVMMKLRDKLLEQAKELKTDAPLDRFLKGYREALNKVTNDIDTQMLQEERKEMIAFAYAQIEEIDSEIGDLIYKKVPQEIYKEAYENIS